MIPHLLIVDDEEEVLESLIPGFVQDLSRRLSQDAEFLAAAAAAGFELPKGTRPNIRVTASGYESAKLRHFAYHRPVHFHLHLCCERGGSFRHALRLIKEQFFAVVVSDLRFADDLGGARAGKLFIEDVQRRNEETFCILYSAYQNPESFPASRFVRKTATGPGDGDRLLAKVVEGLTHYFRLPSIQRFCSELSQRGLVYQSDAFGATLRRLYDIATLYFGLDGEVTPGRRRPLPTLLLDGESGTGKTEMAGLVHRISERRNQPFVASSCGQLTDENLLRSTLFGHVKGAFSGANTDRAGLVLAAQRGILLLDDLHKLTAGSSVILHSFLDDGDFAHVGQDEVRRHAESAIVVTVETPRWEELKGGDEVSESFIHRVEQLVVRVPPLYARPEDIEYQASWYCQFHANQIGAEMELEPGAIAWLVDFGFPGGNSRWLRDFVRGLVSTNARATDLIGTTEVEEYAAEIGLFSRPKAGTGTPPVATGDGEKRPASQGKAPAPRDAEPSPEVTWSAPLEPGSWQARMVRLGHKALCDELGMERQAAERLCCSLFERQFPSLWESFREVTQADSTGATMDIRLFDELFRCFAIFRFGNPAKAAKELRMKDNALREFIYSREEKRGLTQSS